MARLVVWRGVDSRLKLFRMQTTAVVIEDDAAIRRVVLNALTGEVGRIHETTNAADGMAMVVASRPVVVILDLGLPDLPGIDVCRDIRKWSPVPILVLSAHHSEAEKVALLDAGADDYLTKPFGTAELVARVRAILRRTSRMPNGEHVLTFGTLAIDLGARTLRISGNEVHLTPIEWELLRILASAPGRTLTHRHLFNEVWSPRSSGDAQQYLRVHIANLRRKIEVDSLAPRYIVTEPGVGYRFVGPR
jgi:two-component system KDP operon response regulator KdpE